MAPGTRSKFGAPMFEPEIFRKHIHCIEESTCELSQCWDFSVLPAVISPSNSNSAPGELCPPRYAPGHWAMFWILQPYMSKLLVVLVCQEVFFTRHYYLLA